MVLELYLDLHSQPCRSVFIFAKVNKIPFEFKKVDLTTGQQYGEEFGKISVLRKVPAMRDGDFILSESIAILTYLAQKFSTPDHWYPADLRKRARVNEYLSWQHMAMRAHGSKVFLLKSMYKMIVGSDVPKEKMDSAIEDLNNTVKTFEEKFLQDRPFIIGEQISLADLVAIVEILQPVCTGVDVFKDRPKLAAWRDRVKKELGQAVFDEAHEPIVNIHQLRHAMENNSMLESLKPKLRKLFN